jgi:hypothetical protein
MKLGKLTITVFAFIGLVASLPAPSGESLLNERNDECRGLTPPDCPQGQSAFCDCYPSCAYYCEYDGKL